MSLLFVSVIGGSVSDLSFTKLRPEIQEFVPGELNISKSFGILSSVKLSNKSHDTELKVLKSCSFVKDKSGTLPPCSLAAAKIISAFVDFLAVCIFSC
jgi:hypothetical protein